MEAEGLFEKYAIGGGIASLFYIEPVVTYDLDIFIILPQSDKSLLMLSPLYDWLGGKGYKALKEHIVIENIPVQFIPAYSDLVVKAVLESQEKTYEGLTVRVVRPEYLMAIMLDTNRAKDRERMIRMLDQAELSKEQLEAVLHEHDLMASYQEFLRKIREE